MSIDSRTASPAAPGFGAWTLFLASVLALFVELMLIRWIGTEVRIFAYLQNTILVVCFLGLGLGFWTCRAPVEPRSLLLPLVLLLGLLAVPLTRKGLMVLSLKLSVLQDFFVWEQAQAADPLSAAADVAAGLGVTFFLLALVLWLFLPLGRLMGRLMAEDPRPIRAYSANIAGSLVGILGFAALSALRQPPLTWCAVTALLAVLVFRLRRPLDLALAATLPALALVAHHAPALRTPEEGFENRIEEVVWSPYQKLMLWEMAQLGPEPRFKMHFLEVNNVNYMNFLDLRPETLARWPKLFDPRQAGYSQYDVPLRLRPAPKKMLVVGSGSGNDIAAGLRHGAERVVAVEIDPAIIDLATAHHREQPYRDPRVTVIADDARAYFSRSAEKFDLIVFGLLDSHTSTALTNARLDHYVYTAESIAQAKRLLTDDGVLLMSFAATQPFIADRMARALKEAFGEEPVAFRVPASNYGLSGALFIAGDLKAVRARIAADPKLAAFIEEWRKADPLQFTYTTKVTTDDWPYVYLEAPTIPILFWLLGAMLLALFAAALARLKTPGLFAAWSGVHWHFFFLGAAFMLLETQNISKAAVLLGNTWDVNAVIITAILLLALAANAVAALLPRLPLAPIYALLVGSCLGLYFLDLSLFAGLPYLARAGVVGGLTCLPIFFSGIVFVRSFAAAPDKDRTMGANLFGALVGGLLQSVTYLTGMKALLLMVAGLYLLAFLFRPREAGAQS